MLPGIVDTHVHVNEPGRTGWEGFRTAGRAAAAGGVTTMVVMPLNCDPVATDVPSLLAEVEAAAGSCIVDHGFWGGLVPGNVGRLGSLWEAGVLGFKCFMVHSGIDEFPNVTERDLNEAMPVLAELTSGGAVLLAHAEDPMSIDAARERSGIDRSPRSYRAYLASRPAEAEVQAIQTLIGCCRRRTSRVHVVHVAAADALRPLAAARLEGLPISAETCPHYLALAAEDIGDGRTVYKCAPPIRDRTNQEKLWSGLGDGTLDLVASDHSPCPPELTLMTQGDFSRAWGGISSVQLTLPVLWTHAARRGLTLEDVTRWLSAAPARLAGIDGFKGSIAPGFDADLTVFDPEAVWTVRASELQHRHKITPYDADSLRGSVVATFVRGVQVYAAPGFQRVSPVGDDGFASETTGQWVKRSQV